MQTTTGFFVLFSLFAVLFACSEKDNPLGAIDDQFTYPLKIGNKWQYEGDFKQINFRPENGIVASPETTFTFTSDVEILRSATLLDSIETYVLKQKFTDELVFETESYYGNQNDGLYYYASNNRFNGQTLPKSSGKRLQNFSRLNFHTPIEVASFIDFLVSTASKVSDSLYIEDPPLRAMPYPLEVGSQWIYKTQSIDLSDIEKKVISNEQIKVPAGTFECVKIQWILHYLGIDLEKDVEFYDYVSSVGLVQRSILFKDQVITNETGPEPIGLIDTKLEYRLTRVGLK